MITYDIIKKIHVPDCCYDFPFQHDYCKQRRFSYGLKIIAQTCLLKGSGWRILSTCSRLLSTCFSFKTTKATELFRKHSNFNYHKNVVVDLHTFMHRLDHHQLTVHDMAARGHAQSFALNRLKLKSILKSIIWCGKHNFALVGR